MKSDLALPGDILESFDNQDIERFILLLGTLKTLTQRQEKRNSDAVISYQQHKQEIRNLVICKTVLITV